MRYLIALLALLSAAALAQTAPSFTVMPATGPGPFTITWNAQNGTNCQAAGIADWSGAVATSGTKLVIPAVGTKTLTIACTIPGAVTKGSVTLLWKSPILNTDGTPLNDLAGYKLLYGTSANSLTQQVTLTNPVLTSYIVTGLNAGTWFFGMTAFKATGAESALSNVVSKAMTDTAATQPWTASATITVTAPTKPNPPVLTVTNATAYNVVLGKNQVRIVKSGTVPLKTPCSATQNVNGYSLVDRAKVKSSVPLALAVVAKCG